MADLLPMTAVCLLAAINGANGTLMIASTRQATTALGV
jgi:hypothetical protein